jgi:hypothetical protein
MHFNNVKKFIVFSLLAAGCVATHAADSRNLSMDQVLQACRKTADWQLANPNRKPIDNWAQGPSVNELFANSKMQDNKPYLDTTIKMGEKESWGVITTIHPATSHSGSRRTMGNDREPRSLHHQSYDHSHRLRAAFVPRLLPHSGIETVIRPHRRSWKKG